MTQSSPIRRPSEEGYILIWVIFLLAVFSIALSVAVPRMAKQIQLDRERETMQRGLQYRRAVQLYYRRFNAYPPNVGALVKTNEIRFLRKKYIDPITGKDDWKPVLFGQNKAPTAMGFFGQPLAGSASTIAGTGPSGGNGLNSGSTFSGSSSSMGGGPSAFGGSSSSLGGSPSAFGSSGSTMGAGMSTGSAGSATGTSGDPSSGSSGGVGGTGSTGTSGSSTGQTFGGAGIIGFSPGSTKTSIMIYKKKSHYNEWEFVYDPLSEMKTISGNTGNIGTPASSTSTPVGGTPASSGTNGQNPSSFGSTTFGPSTFGSSTPQ